MTEENRELAPREGVVTNPGRGRGVRVAELGRQPVVINLNDGERLSISDLVERGHLSGGPDAEVYVNMIPVRDPHQTLVDGDNVVAIRKVAMGKTIL